MSEAMTDTSIDEVFGWGDRTGFMGRERFGRRGAHANSKTYEELKRRCDRVEKPHWANNFCSSLFYINSFNVHISEDVPDGVLRPCDCGKDIHDRGIQRAVGED